MTGRIASQAPADAGASAVPDDERMTAAELRVILGWLGLRQRDAARLLGVHERTVRHWLAGATRIPDGVRVEVEEWESATARAVGELVQGIYGRRAQGVHTYRTDEVMWRERPEIEPWPASWWDQVVARAAHEVPGLEIEDACP